MGGRVCDTRQIAVSDGRWHTSKAWPAEGGVPISAGEREFFMRTCLTWRGGVEAHALPHAGIWDKGQRWKCEGAPT